uniref:NADH-ubiquinone oxidoreductase chain 2 n=1 Tax=Crassostrea nippona TaxID=2602933 RepID=F1ASX5_CRANI|nr:NADH dehydrogenase subunit 2 [Crassostrea nippona]ADE18726.1 NADH dehydrogenase subunit 2 [Crassostrea nippona]
MQLLSMVVFLTLSIMSSIVMMFVSSLFWVWVMTDMSTIFMIPFLSGETRRKKSWFTGVATYFIVQFFGSAMILISMIIQWGSPTSPYCSALMCFGFSLKLGLVPLHFWVARSFIHFHYGGIFVVGAGQKVFIISAVPLFSDVPICANVFYWSAMVSMLYGPVAMFHAITVKSFLAYSSVNHTGFLVICSYFGLHLVFIYAFIYCVSMFFLNFFFWSGGCKLMKDLGTELPLHYKTGFFSIGLSFCGFPPFLDFCTKFLVIQLAIECQVPGVVVIILASSLINLVVWIWVISLAASCEMRESFTPTGSVGQNVLNISCVIWNLFMGMGFSMLY